MIDDKTLDKWEKRAKNYINFGESNLGRQDPNITVYECVQSHHALTAVIKDLRVERKWSAECEAKLKMIMSHADAISLNGGDTLNTHWIVNRCIETINQKPKEIIE